MTEGPMRLLGNPDEIGCRSLMANLELEAGEEPFPGLGGPEDGILEASGMTLPCETRFESAMPAGRQHWLTVLAARAFFESHFAADPRARADHALFLTRTLPEELSEIHYTPARRSS